MSRFNKSSKYKNAIPRVHKKEKWINDLKVGSNLRSTGNHIKASCDYIAFVQDSNSIGSLAIIPIDACGRFSGFPLITGHSGLVTDFDFSPFSSNLLATGSEDGVIKLWDIPNELNETLRLSESALSFGPFDIIENLLFHPSANNILAASSKNSVYIFDVNSQKKCLELDGHEDIVESISWHGNGHLMSTICKSGAEKSLKVFDPRESKSCVSVVKYHSGQKPACTLCLSSCDSLITAGYNKTREAELVLWNLSSFDKPLSRQSLGTATSGSPSVVYDGDSKMVFAALKSESTITFYDCSQALTPGQQTYRGSQQTKGIAMVPKRRMDVMSCEIVRLLQLTQSAIIPISYHVQRKSYSEFHADLYPDTPGEIPAMSAEQWFQGSNALLGKVSLDPRNTRKLNMDPKAVNIEQAKPTCEVQQDAVIPRKGGTAATKSITVVRSSKFRHIEGKSRHSSTFITKIPALSSTVPGDSNAFQANRDRVAAVLSGSGGQIGIFELKKAGRLDTVDVPTLQNGSAVIDFAFDPFNPCRIVVACEDAKIRLWVIPEGGLSETLTQPEYLVGHRDKANILAFHPQAESLMASAGYDGQLLLWDLSSCTVALSLDKLNEPLYCMAWSPNGNQLATFGRDHLLSMFEPRSSLSAVNQLRGPEGSRGARLVWLEDSVVAISGFSKSGMRTVNLYNINTSNHLSEIQTSVMPAILIPYFDTDTRLLFLTGKGDNTILAYEYVKPYLFDVAPFNCSSSHQGVAFLPKTLCDVTKVEIEVGVRLTRSSVEGFTVQVPRTRLNYFQDDIYPDTLCVEKACLTVKQWLHGDNAIQTLQSLKPPHMKSLSDAPKEAPAAKKFESYNPDYKSDQQKKEELLSAMVERMGEKEDPLPQQDMDGADSDEWSD